MRTLLKLFGATKIAPPIFRGVSRASWSAATTISVPIPPEAKIGDQLLLCIVSSTQPVITTPSGWVLIRSQAITGGGLIAVYERQLVGGLVSPVAVTIGSSSGDAAIVAYSPATSLVSGATDNASSSTPTTPSVTPANTVNTTIVRFWGLANTQTISSFSTILVPRLNWTNNVTIGIADNAQPGPGGGAGARSVTLSGAVVSGGITDALKVR